MSLLRGIKGRMRQEIVLFQSKDFLAVRAPYWLGCFAFMIFMLNLNICLCLFKTHASFGTQCLWYECIKKTTSTGQRYTWGSHWSNTWGSSPTQLNFFSFTHNLWVSLGFFYCSLQAAPPNTREFSKQYSLHFLASQPPLSHSTAAYRLSLWLFQTSPFSDCCQTS